MLIKKSVVQHTFCMQNEEVLKSNFKTNRAKLVPNGRVVSKQNIVFIFKPIRHKNCLWKP